MSDQQKHEEPKKGIVFRRYDEVQQFMNNYMKCSQQIFVKGSTKPDGSCKIKKKTKSGNQLSWNKLYL